MAGQPQNAGQIQIKQGKWSAETCTTQNDLIINQATKPVYRKMLERRNGRYLMTLLTSGAMGPLGFNDVDTKVPMVDNIKVKEAAGIGNIAYRWDVLGRIEKKATVVSQSGSSGVTGAFTLKMLDTYLYKNQVIRMPSGRRAITLSQGSGSSASGFLYNFQMTDGTAFVFSTDIGNYKSVFPEYTAYSEGSLKSDSRDKHPDTFMNFMTIQRKTVAITGSAKSDVLWYEYADGEKIGWMWWKANEAKAQFAMENERQKKFGISSMKGANGALLTQSSYGNDPETGLPIITGDGAEEQISASNVFVASGVNGEATIDDFTNAMTTMVVGSNQVNGVTWVSITGTTGFVNAQQQMINLAGNQNVQLMQMVTQQADKSGGAYVDMGYTFAKFNFAGNSMWFIIDPMFDDTEYFPEVGADGKSLMSGSYMILGVNTTDKPTMEIMCKEANGVNRAHVEANYVGLTGSKGQVLSEVDADKVAMLKEDMLCLYNPSLFAMLYKAA